MYVPMHVWASELTNEFHHRTFLTLTASGTKNCLKQTRTDCLAVPTKVWTPLGAGTLMQKSAALLVIMPIPSYEQSRSKGSVLWLYEIHGENLSGQVHGQMDRKNGRKSGWICCLRLVIRSETMGSSLWSVSDFCFLLSSLLTRMCISH